MVLNTIRGSKTASAAIHQMFVMTALTSSQASLLNNLFASLDNVTIETLKSRLAAQQEADPGANGLGDLSALLRAANIELSLDDIVLPPLTQVRK